MSATKLIVAIGLCVVLCLALGWTVQPAHAQKGMSSKDLGGVGGDKSIGSKKGMDVFTSSKKLDEKRLPTRTKKIVGVGSIFVMVAALKWL